MNKSNISSNLRLPFLWSGQTVTSRRDKMADKKTTGGETTGKKAADLQATDLQAAARQTTGQADRVAVGFDFENRWSFFFQRMFSKCLVGCFCLTLLLVTGCRGCSSETPAEKIAREKAEVKLNELKEKKKKKRPFVLSLPRVQPNQLEEKTPDIKGDEDLVEKIKTINNLDSLIVSNPDQQFIKPGHWSTLSQRMIANEADFVGTSTITILDARGKKIPVGSTPYNLRSSRPVALSKGEAKHIESTFYLPGVVKSKPGAEEPLHNIQERYFIQTALDGPRAYNAIQPEAVVTAFNSYQYYFVVLAKEPARYLYLNMTDFVKVPFGGDQIETHSEDTIHYRVVTPHIEKRIPLPDTALTMTSIAYILWDEVNPGTLTPLQKTALLDWLHWGGQLIISGPDSLASLKGSFLDPYLPAEDAGAKTFTPQDLASFNSYWKIKNKRTKKTDSKKTSATFFDLKMIRPWSGISLKLRPNAVSIPGMQKLLVERPVGNGRIVLSAFHLNEPDLINWKFGFDSWFNACLLRRPFREYIRTDTGDLTLNWGDPKLAAHRLDASFTSHLRYFSRDLGVDSNYSIGTEVVPDGSLFSMGEIEIDSYLAPVNSGGIGAWNDYSATANAARKTLTEAAKIEIPDASFVVYSLVAYLIVLVPFNWGVFYTIGRLEWAWVAAPILAILGTVFVVRQAQLDIGFVRSQTEIAILELQGGYPRGHLTRYTALYTSLSSGYDIKFKDPHAFSIPFSVKKFGEVTPERTDVIFKQHDTSSLAGMSVDSNTTKMIHSEEMFSLAGPIKIGKSSSGTTQIENLTNFDLHSVGLVRRIKTSTGTRLEGCWIGNLFAKQSAALGFTLLAEESRSSLFAAERATEEKEVLVKRLDLEPMFRLAYNRKYLPIGEVRLVARIDKMIPGMTTTPVSSQLKGSTLVVSHLKYAPLPPLRPDLNTRAGMKERRSFNISDLDLSNRDSEEVMGTGESLEFGDELKEEAEPMLDAAKAVEATKEDTLNSESN